MLFTERESKSQKIQARMRAAQQRALRRYMYPSCLRQP